MAKTAAKKPAKKTGRPSGFSQSAADTICARIADGESLRSICAEKAMPSRAAVFKWLQDFPIFADQYARAREDQAETYADDVVRIADQELDANRARVRIDARKWAAGKLKPKKYGDKVVNEHSGPDGAPIETVALSPTEAARKAAFMLAKGLKDAKRKA
jgi:hypothetical protein